jgi:hypothetical protein
MVQQHFGHLRAAGIAGAQHQHGVFFVSHDGFLDD